MVAGEGSEPEATEGAVEIPLIWVGADDLQVLAVNQWLLQHDSRAGEYFLVGGILTPPVVLGSLEAQREHMLNLGYVPVQAVARFSLSGHRLRELRDLLDRAVRALEQGKLGDDEEGPSPADRPERD